MMLRIFQEKNQSDEDSNIINVRMCILEAIILFVSKSIFGGSVTLFFYQFNLKVAKRQRREKENILLEDGWGFIFIFLSFFFWKFG